jgi:zinc/manganese transport system substrate-binding protein
MRVILGLMLVLGAAAGCSDAGGDDDGVGAGGRPQVVVTTTILGDVVREVVGDQAEVSVVMPSGADPHEFAASARQAEAITDADLLVVNGAGFEQGIGDVLDAATDGGTPTFAFAEHVALRQLDGSDDPHLWLDPVAMSEAVGALGDALAAVEGIDAAAVEADVETYRAELTALDAEVEALLAPIPEDDRVLVTNHEVLGYFADRYGFEVIGAVVPSLSTSAEPSAADVDDLADLVRDRGVPAIFAETTQPTTLAEALAEAVGRDVEVVELFSESLGEPGSGADTYLGLVRTDAERIAGALT